MTALPDPDYQAEFYTGVPAKRLFAWVVDSLLITIAAILLVPFTGFVGLFVWPAFYLAVGLAYRVVTIANGSATPGMTMAGIELRSAEGARLDLGQAALHTLAYSVSLAFFPLQLLSIVLMLSTARGQSLPDHLLGTVMLRRRA
ncbi:RDD family protein [Tritonibacter multivorans]|uniref:RDD family protein n=1 Tax=Tritonibacter multivorans TaxID=928856 RepID=A0A0P1GFQ8_9RHOB|nr:RDD family protein [Tritonibacter multivorans]MDA7420853.1 RDD family protein [Tritonibacter multivorans]CUH80624.1 RDD family protein [Tritonibacter multivorans]SFC84516.1 RDD family protein [Tritonibacter multivorans]